MRFCRHRRPRREREHATRHGQAAGSRDRGRLRRARRRAISSAPGSCASTARGARRRSRCRRRRRSPAAGLDDDHDRPARHDARRVDHDGSAARRRRPAAGSGRQRRLRRWRSSRVVRGVRRGVRAVRRSGFVAAGRRRRRRDDSGNLNRARWSGRAAHHQRDRATRGHLRAGQRALRDDEAGGHVRQRERLDAHLEADVPEGRHGRRPRVMLHDVGHRDGRAGARVVVVVDGAGRDRASWCSARWSAVGRRWWSVVCGGARVIGAGRCAPARLRRRRPPPSRSRSATRPVRDELRPGAPSAGRAAIRRGRRGPARAAAPPPRPATTHRRPRRRRSSSAGVCPRGRHRQRTPCPLRVVWGEPAGSAAVTRARSRPRSFSRGALESAAGRVLRVGGWDARHWTTVGGPCRRAPDLGGRRRRRRARRREHGRVVPRSSSACTGKTR